MEHVQEKSTCLNHKQWYRWQQVIPKHEACNGRKVTLLNRDKVCETVPITGIIPLLPECAHAYKHTHTQCQKSRTKGRLVEKWFQGKWNNDTVYYSLLSLPHIHIRALYACMHISYACIITHMCINVRMNTCAHERGVGG